MQYGILHEKDGLDIFMKQFSQVHTGSALETKGLIIYDKIPFLGASPDGVATCGCCPKGVLLEVKSPYRLRETGLNSWKVLEYFNENQKLKQNHTYFHQIQFYLGVLGLEQCHLIIYAKK